MKKLALLAAVLLGTAAASQAEINIHIGIPLPPLPQVIFSHRPPVVVVPRLYPPPLFVAPPCRPNYGYGYSHYQSRYGSYRHHCENEYCQAYRSHGREYSRDRQHGHR